MAELEDFEITDETTIGDIIFSESLDGTQIAWMNNLLIKHLGIREDQMGSLAEETILEIAEDNKVSEPNLQILIQELNEATQANF